MTTKMVTVNESTFQIGSPFSLSIPFFPSKKSRNISKDDSTVVINISKGTCLKLSSCHLELKEANTGSARCTLCFSHDENKNLMDLATFIPVSNSSYQGIWNQSLLGLNISGERSIRFGTSIKSGNYDVFQDGYVNIFGSVVPDSNNVDNNDVQVEKSNNAGIKTTQKNISENIIPDKKRKLNELGRSESNVVIDEEEEDEEKKDSNKPHGKDSTKVITLSKQKDEDVIKQGLTKSERKARKKLAKEKAKALREVVAKEQGHFNEKTIEDKNTATAEPSKRAKTTQRKSPYSERRLSGGIVVKDILIGDGAEAKLGKRASILYTGSFPDGKVFDKNQTKSSPLQFRVGTGEVIRGLELGLEGMRVNGERTIVIPPHLGYGKKGSGNVIPSNATLVFEVKLLAVGIGGKK